LRVMDDVWLKNHIQFLTLPDHPSIKAHSAPARCANSALLQDIAGLTERLINHELPLERLRVDGRASLTLVRATEAIAAQLPFWGEFRFLALEPAGFLQRPIRQVLNGDKQYHHPLLHIIVGLASQSC
jgi:hypothetical protein